MAKNLNVVFLSEPSVDPDIDDGGNFSMVIYGTYSGGGSVNGDFWFEWDQGTDTWQQIPESDTGVGLWSDSETDYVSPGVAYESGNPLTITVYGNYPGVYKIRAHGYRATDFYDPAADPWFTVTVNEVGGALTIDVADGLGSSEALD